MLEQENQEQQKRLQEVKEGEVGLSYISRQSNELEIWLNLNVLGSHAIFFRKASQGQVTTWKRRYYWKGYARSRRGAYLYSIIFRCQADLSLCYRSSGSFCPFSSKNIRSLSFWFLINQTINISDTRTNLPQMLPTLWLPATESFCVKSSFLKSLLSEESLGDRSQESLRRSNPLRSTFAFFSGKTTFLMTIFAQYITNASLRCEMRGWQLCQRKQTATSCAASLQSGRRKNKVTQSYSMERSLNSIPSCHWRENMAAWCFWHETDFPSSQISQFFWRMTEKLKSALSPLNLLFRSLLGNWNSWQDLWLQYSVICSTKASRLFQKRFHTGLPQLRPQLRMGPPQPALGK